MGVERQIYRIMKEKLISQAAAARAVGLSPQSFNDMLRGRKLIRQEHVPKICKALRCEPNELFGYIKEDHQITVTTDDGEVVATVEGDLVVEHEGYHVILS